MLKNEVADAFAYSIRDCIQYVIRHSYSRIFEAIIISVNLPRWKTELTVAAQSLE
jgi:hypothetical protein